MALAAVSHVSTANWLREDAFKVARRQMVAAVARQDTRLQESPTKRGSL